MGWKIEIDFSDPDTPIDPDTPTDPDTPIDPDTPTDPDTPMAEPKPPESESSSFRMVSYYYHHFMCIYILFTQTIASLFELTIMLFVTILLQHLYC